MNTPPLACAAGRPTHSACRHGEGRALERAIKKVGMGEAFSCVLSGSNPESEFAQDCSNDERVRFFFKLPSRFKIPTPLGNYNPDWAVVFERDARVYFVAETKSSTVEKDRRRNENLKIACGRKHFELSTDVVPLKGMEV